MIHRHKFNARPAERNGYRFDSQKEARYYDQLTMLQKTGAVVMFLRQVPFHLPGGVTYRVDFQVFYADGTVEFIDVKGHKTKEYITKKKMVEALYPVLIREV
uniref:DUF1064 domain-containing protein n=1 Tax=viral metagenome TaxID=1070528 RepID=A0A6H1ZZR9_9ZZZZ